MCLLLLAAASIDFAFYQMSPWQLILGLCYNENKHCWSYLLINPFIVPHLRIPGWYLPLVDLWLFRCVIWKPTFLSTLKLEPLSSYLEGALYEFLNEWLNCGSKLKAVGPHEILSVSVCLSVCMSVCLSLSLGQFHELSYCLKQCEQWIQPRDSDLFSFVTCYIFYYSIL